MRLDNYTDDIDDQIVREIIRFACPPGVTGYDVVVRNGSVRDTYTGRAYPADWHVTARLGPKTLFPIGPRAPRRGGYLPDPWLRDRTEALVFILAHELRHLWQARIPRGRRVWGSRGQYSERDADAYALRTLRAWRRARHSPEIT